MSYGKKLLRLTLKARSRIHIHLQSYAYSQLYIHVYSALKTHHTHNHNVTWIHNQTNTSMIILTHFNTCTLRQAYIQAHTRMHTH